MQEFMTYEQYLRDVKKGIVTDLGNCPVTPLLIMLQGKWKTQILYELCIYDTVRFSVLKKDLAGITNTMLTNALRELEADGFINRVQFNEIPPHVEYSPESVKLIVFLCQSTIGLAKHRKNVP